MDKLDKFILYLKSCLCLDGQIYFICLSSEHTITEAGSLEYSLVFGTTGEDCRMKIYSLKLAFHCDIDISKKHRCKIYHMDASDNNLNIHYDILLDLALLKTNIDEAEITLCGSISDDEKAQLSDIIFNISSPLSSDNRQSDVFHKCPPNCQSFFCGVAESNQNEDLDLSQSDRAAFSEMEWLFFYERNHYNDIWHYDKACAFNFYYLFSCDELIKEELEKDEMKNEKQKKEVIHTKVEREHHQKQFMDERIKLIRKKYYSIKQSMKRYKMNKYRMFLSHLKQNDITKSTFVQEYGDSKAVKKTASGEITLINFDTKKSTKLELHPPINKSNRKVAGTMLHKSVEDYDFQVAKTEKEPINWKYKSLCDEESDRYPLFLDNCIRKSRMLSNIKVNDTNLNTTKTLKNDDPRVSPSEKGETFMDALSHFYLNLNYALDTRMFLQEVIVYPFTRHDPEVNTPQGDPHQFMHYEVFRLCSFSYTRFPSNFDVWVTQLAQAGFYCFDQNGKIICFDCGQEFIGAMNSPIENVHHPDCLHHQRSRPLHMWTQGLNQEVLAIYYNRYGSLRPFNFETSGPVGMTLQQGDEASSISHFASSEPQIGQNNELSPNETSLERWSSIPPLVMVDRDEPAREDIRPPYHSETVSSVASETNINYHPFNDEQHSLPGNINDISGVLVSEESVIESHGSPEIYQVLTSAARNPVRYYGSSSHSSHYQQAEGGAENGAVGGADPTLDLSKASYPLFSSATARRQSFTNWQPDHSHRPDDLVAAGFFYAGYADCVRCFYCGLGLKYWRATDIPAYQHARYRPYCVYNLLYKGQDYIDRVQQDIQIEQGPGAANQNTLPRPSAQTEVAAAVVTSTTTGSATVVTAPATGSATEVTTPTTVQAQVTHARVLAPDTAPQISNIMDLEVAQEALRNGWERNQVQQAIDHIIRELGESCLEISLLLDVLTNLNMNNLGGNLPSGESTESSDSDVNENVMDPSSLASVRDPSPENINVNRERCVDVADSGHEGEGAPPQTRPAPIQQPAPPHVEFTDLFRTVEREHTLLAERTTCRLCLLRQVSCIFLPCGHVIACQECADNATHCVLCQKQIIGTANIYLA